MSGLSLTVSREYTSEPEAIWEVLTDLDQTAKVLTAVMAIRRIDGPKGFQVGTRWRETRLALGGHVTEEFTVTEVVPGQRATVEADVMGGHLTIVYRLKEMSLGTRLEADMSVVPPATGLGKKLFSSVSGGHAVKVAREMLERDLADIAAFLRE